MLAVLPGTAFTPDHTCKRSGGPKFFFAGAREAGMIRRSKGLAELEIACTELRMACPGTLCFPFPLLPLLRPMACLTPAPLTEANLANLARLPLRHSPMPSATPTAEAKPSLSLPLGSTSYRPPPPRSNPPSPTTVHSAIAAKERDGAMFSPSLAAILFAYGENGAGDKELLKAILVAKAEEDKVCLSF